MFLGLFTILPFTACLFWTMVLLLDWRRDNAAQHVLTVFMGVCAMLYLCHAVFFNHESSITSISECIYAFCNIGVFPLYYLYICRLTERKGLSARHFAVLLPAIAICLWTTMLHIFCSGDKSSEEVRLFVMRVVFMVQLLPICWVCYRRLRKFDDEISNYYADTEGRSVQSTSRMMGLLVGGALLSGIANFIGRDYFDTSEFLISVPSVLFTLLLFGVGYVGKRQEFCIDDLVRDEERYPLDDFTDVVIIKDEADTGQENEPEESPITTTEEPSAIITRLNALMTGKCLYLRPDLCLSEVATILGVGRTKLSQHINQELHVSFSNYVNNLRIDHACRLLADPDWKKLSLTGVAEMSGFSSDSSFYRAFRRRTGMTPKQYLDSL